MKIRLWRHLTLLRPLCLPCPGPAQWESAVPQLEAWVFNPRPQSESPWPFLNKSVHVNRSDKKQISGIGLPPIAKIKFKK